MAERCRTTTLVYRVSGGFLSRRRVQHVRFRLLALWRVREYWRAATEATWEEVERADEARVDPGGDWRWRPAR